MMRSRKGDWIQIFLVLFFVFIVILALALLTIQGQSEEETSEQAVISYGDAQAHVALVFWRSINRPAASLVKFEGPLRTT